MTKLHHYTGRISFNYKLEGREILIGDYYHDAKEFKNEPWTAPEINTFKNKRKQRNWLTRAAELLS